MSCFGFNVVKLYTQQVRKMYERAGLRSSLVELDNGSTIHCWIPAQAPQESCEKPSLMLVHGFGTIGCIAWEKQIRAVSRFFAVYVPDLLFFGGSSTKSKQRSEAFQAECLVKLLRKQGVHKVMVAGSSYGGFVAFRMAELDPGLVSKVVIVGSGICMTPSSNDRLLEEFGASDITQVLLPESVEGQRKLLETCVYKPPKFLPGCILQGIIDEFRENREQLVEVIHGMEIGSARSPELPKLKQQVLIVWGSHDQVFDMELAKQLKSHLGDSSQLVVIPEAGHLPHIEKPKEFNKCILEFLLHKH